MTSVDSLLSKTKSDIEKYGWSAVGVMPTIDDPGPTFTYTIGFQEHGHPELIVVGLAPEVAHTMLYGLYERVKQGDVFEDGQRDNGVLDDYDVLFKAVPADGRPLNMARNYYDLDELPALQVVWPDAQGLFPDEWGFDPKFYGKQDLEAIRNEDAP